MFLLIISLVLPVHITFAQSQTAAEGQFPQSIIAASSTDTTPHVLELRATQDGDNAEPKKVSGFKLDMTNVVTAQINSQVLVFVTDSSVKVSEAKVRTVSRPVNRPCSLFSSKCFFSGKSSCWSLYS
jgi:hypothetical protein